MKNSIKKILSSMLFSTLLLSFVGCSNNSDALKNNSDTEQISAASLGENTTLTQVNTIDSSNSKLEFNNSTWNYDQDNDVYWQIGVIYCDSPVSTDYESLGIYVPGAYMNGVKNSDGTYTCTLNTSGNINGYTSSTAPVVIPVNTPGYSAQNAPTSYNYDGLSSYLKSGFIYVYAGCRGRSNNKNNNAVALAFSGSAPWGVTDLKAAVRYLRYNEEILPGDTDKIFTFGHSGGGAQSSLMGATGDSELYIPYLKSIGAAMENKNGESISDAICGAMCWCPITSLDYADEAYEWMMGQYVTTGTRADGTFTSALSDDLSKAFAEYINKLGLTDENGNALTLSESENGVYTSGSYYDYVLSQIESSLNNFLKDTTFPYTSGGNKQQAGGNFPGGGQNGGGMPSGDRGPNGSNVPNNSPVTYENIQDYIDSLNSDGSWIEYDKETNTAKITSIEAFVTHCKNASKNVGAFDDLNRSQAENSVFGDDKNNPLHFDSTMAQLLKDNEKKYSAFSDWDESYVKAYEEYLNSVDSLGNSSLVRQNMYNPMYYLSKYYDGYGKSTVASHWRINTGINQSDTSLTVETNLALLLEQNENVKDVNFETVWAQGHTMAERDGNSTTNFIDWVDECSK